MASWIFDEDINKPTVTHLGIVGIKGVHLAYDLNKGGVDDETVLQIAKHEKKTLVTANYNDFRAIDEVQIVNSCGVWILPTDDPKKQVELMVNTLRLTGLTTLSSRKHKKVDIKKSGEVHITNTKKHTKQVIASKIKNNQKIAIPKKRTQKPPKKN